MSRVPRVSSAELIKIPEHRGYVQSRTVGSHVRFRHPQRPPTTVPLHNIIDPGLTLPDLFDE